MQTKFVNLNMSKGEENSISLKAIGEAIQSKRNDDSIENAEVQKSAGLSYNTISKLENGGDIYLSSFLKICFALDIHPKDLLDIDFDVILPGNPAKKTDKSKSTRRLNDLIEDGYFDDWKSTGEVVEELNRDHPVEVESNSVSSLLGRLHRDGELLKRNKKNSNRLKEYKKV